MPSYTQVAPAPQPDTTAALATRMSALESAFTCMDTRVSVALARLESRLAEVDQEKEKKMALMRETLIASVKALRIERQKMKKT